MQVSPEDNGGLYDVLEQGARRELVTDKMPDAELEKLKEIRLAAKLKVLAELADNDFEMREDRRERELVV